MAFCGDKIRHYVITTYRYITSGESEATTFQVGLLSLK